MMKIPFDKDMDRQAAKYGGWMVLWSESQGCFHINFATDELHKNIDAYLRRRSGDWITLTICETHDKAQAFVEHARALRDVGGLRHAC